MVTRLLAKSWSFDSKVTAQVSIKLCVAFCLFKESDASKGAYRDGGNVWDPDSGVFELEKKTLE